jgi:cell division protein FtsI/penicillin-binding protein 2
MFEVVNSPTGSGRRAKINGLTIYGKTGSAEIGSRKNRKINAWFIAYTQYEGKIYALALVIEDATSGSLDCAPLAGGLLRDYILGHVAKDEPSVKKEERIDSSIPTIPINEPENNDISN